MWNVIRNIRKIVRKFWIRLWILLTLTRFRLQQDLVSFTLVISIFFSLSFGSKSEELLESKKKEVHGQGSKSSSKNSFGMFKLCPKES
jgi:hypothetical protein